MPSPQLSEKVINLLLLAQRDSSSKAKQVAATGARMRLEQDVENRVCLTCEKASWLLTWAPLEGALEWHPILLKCAAGGVLFPQENGHGLEYPLAQFCTAKYESDDQSNGAGSGGYVKPRVTTGSPSDTREMRERVGT